MRESSNPVFRSLPKGQGGYAQFGTGAASFGAQQVQAEPYATQYPDQRQAGPASRSVHLPADAAPWRGLAPDLARI